MLMQMPVPDGMWALVLGPVGTTVVSIFVVVILWRKLNLEREEYKTHLNALHKARHEDLVAGLKYREEMNGKLLADKIEERVTASKLIDAVQGLATQQEKSNETIRMVDQIVREVKASINQRG